MMSVVALSLPEMIILRRVMKPRLIAAHRSGRSRNHADRLSIQRASLSLMLRTAGMVDKLRARVLTRAD
ncbi:MAG: hypothetical protein U0694_12345 [Anaerolineae bacterium]